MRARAIALAFAVATSTSGCTRALEVVTSAQPIEPAAAEALAAGGAALDVRSPDEYAQGHVPGAINVPLLGLNGHLARTRGACDGSLLLVDEDGSRAALGTPVAGVHGCRHVVTLDGGMRRWRSEDRPVATSASLEVDPALLAAPSLKLSRAQQWVSFSSGGLIKPTYMLLALLIAWWLRRQRATPLRLLFHGMLWFFAGEFLCAVNFYFHAPGVAYPVDLLHGLGMVAMSAFVPWGLYKLADERVLRFSDPEQHCLMQRLCGRCWKREPVRCGPHDLMLLVVPALAFVSLMPLTGELLPIQYVTEVFGSKVDYGAPVVNHLVELRGYPLLASLLFLASFPFFFGGPRWVRKAEALFFAGFGFLGYSALRFGLVSINRERLWWSDFWEESTELLLVGSIGLLLLVFRRQLGLVAAPGGPGKAEPSAGPGAGPA